MQLSGTVRRAPYAVKLDVFEGPLDLLLYLIEKEELDIYDIPIARVTEQYLEYLEAMSCLDLDLASEFLVMAATLMDIKARMLLPPPATEVAPETDENRAADPRQELVDRLLEYRRFKQLAEELRQRERAQALTFGRGDGETETAAGVAILPDGLSVFDLVGALRDVLAEVREPPVGEVCRDRYSVIEKMAQLEDLLARSVPVSFRDLARYREREEVVVTFLALLELVRLRRVRVEQRGLFGEILLFPPGPEGCVQ